MFKKELSPGKVLFVVKNKKYGKLGQLGGVDERFKSTVY